MSLGGYIDKDGKASWPNVQPSNPPSALGSAQPIGVWIVGATGNFVGGNAPGSGNQIGGSSTAGILVADDVTGNVASTGNFIQGNFIGIDAYGDANLGNGDGVLLTAASNTVGGTDSGARNWIAGNNDFGVHVDGTGTSGQSLMGVFGNTIAGNYVGTDVVGTSALSNKSGGLDLNHAVGAKNATVDATAAGAYVFSNVISGNQGAGVTLEGGTEYASLWANRIGTTADGLSQLTGQVQTIGVKVVGAQNNQVGLLTYNSTAEERVGSLRLPRYAEGS
jgi:hypothetical protein